jgi:hypothetical protein
MQVFRPHPHDGESQMEVAPTAAQSVSAVHGLAICMHEPQPGNSPGGRQYS